MENVDSLVQLVAVAGQLYDLLSLWLGAWVAYVVFEWSGLNDVLE